MILSFLSINPLLSPVVDNGQDLFGQIVYVLQVSKALATGSVDNALDTAQHGEQTMQRGLEQYFAYSVGLNYIYKKRMLTPCTLEI